MLGLSVPVMQFYPTDSSSCLLFCPGTQIMVLILVGAWMFLDKGQNVERVYKHSIPDILHELLNVCVVVITV